MIFRLFFNYFKYFNYWFFILIFYLFLLFTVVKIQNLADQRIYKSLFVLMLVTFFCWLPVPVLVSYVFPYLHTQQVPADVLNVLQRALLQLNKVAQDLNVPILYICRFNGFWIFKFYFAALNIGRQCAKNLTEYL